MLRKLFTSILLTLLACTFSFAQEVTVLESGDETDIKEMPIVSFLSSSTGGSYLGVYTTEVTKENFAKFGLTGVRGVAVNTVVKDSPAEKAGLQDGDVIIRFNGESVTSTRKLTRLIREIAPDHKASLTILRKGSKQNLTATISNGSFNFPRMSKVVGLSQMRSFPAGKGKWKGENFFISSFSSRSIGVGVSSLTKQLGNHFGVDNGNGLLINRVYKDSPAEKAGLKAGDVIIQADGKNVKNTFDLLRTINEKKEGSVNLTIVRDKNRRNISVTPKKRDGNSKGLYNFRTKGKVSGTGNSNFRILTSPRIL
jgi:serine protease Do